MSCKRTLNGGRARESRVVKQLKLDQLRVLKVLEVGDWPVVAGK